MAWFLILPVATALLANVPNAATAEPNIEPGAPEYASPPAAVAPPEPASGWYGAPALAVDGAVAVGLAALVHATDSRSHSGATSPVLYGLAAAYLLGGPVVHLVHGHRVRSAESFLLRVGALAAGLALTFAIADRPRSGCGDDSWDAVCTAPYALLLSPVAAMIFDDLLLAREPVVQPRLLVQPGLALVGVGGTF